MITQENSDCNFLFALAWVLAQKPWVVPISGIRKLEHLEKNLEVAEINLTSDELNALNDALFKIKVYGDRYSAGSDYANRTGK